MLTRGRYSDQYLNKAMFHNICQTFLSRNINLTWHESRRICQKIPIEKVTTF